MVSWDLGGILGALDCSLRTPGEDEEPRGAYVGGARAQGHPVENGFPGGQSWTCANDAQARHRLPSEVPRTLYPKLVKTLLRALVILKRKGRVQPTQAPNNNQQLTNLFFLNFPEVAMVTCMCGFPGFLL